MSRQYTVSLSAPRIISKHIFPAQCPSLSCFLFDAGQHSFFSINRSHPYLLSWLTSLSKLSSPKTFDAAFAVAKKLDQALRISAIVDRQTARSLMIERWLVQRQAWIERVKGCCPAFSPSSTSGCAEGKCSPSTIYCFPTPYLTNKAPVVDETLFDFTTVCIDERSLILKKALPRVSRRLLEF